MLLNAVERALINNPVRVALQRRFEAGRLLRMGGPTPDAHALEVGCGRGYGVDIILDRFGAERVDAFDLDEKMIVAARERLTARGERVRLWTGDVLAIPSEDATYDAVFDFGIIHHVPDWRGAVREIARVLKPGGRFYAEEVLDRFILHPVWRRLLDHPLEDRFDVAGFAAGLEEAGLRVRATRSLWNHFGWFVAEKA